jgi:hypothetical protein
MTKSGGSCPECQETLRRKPGPDRGPEDVPPIVYDVLRSPGRPLDEGVRTDMAQRFGGADFSEVKIHTDGRASESAEAVNARAYTVGKSIVFGDGEFSPSTGMGRSLLTHELAHTLQQSKTIPTQRLVVSDPQDRAERVAAATARTIAETGRLQPGDTERVNGSLQRQLGDLEVPVAELEDEAEDGDTEVIGTTSEDYLDLTEAAESILQSGLSLLSDFLAPEAEAAETKGKEPGKREPQKKWIKQIDIDLSSQTLVLNWSDGSKSGAHTISSGKGRPGTKEDPCKDQTEENCTPTGSFTVTSRGDANTKNSKGDAMGWYVGFVEARGIGIHNSQPADGSPRAHGCVRVGRGSAAMEFARLINNNVKVGSTIVNISGKASTKPWKKKKK